MIPHTRVLAAGVLALSAFAFAACTATSAPQAQVPTLPAAGSATQPAPAGTSTDADAGRPRERLDMTNDEITALYGPYNQCLAANGDGKPTTGSGGMSAVTVDPGVEAKAETACQSKEPLPPWELDANNPQGADFVHAVVQCLRDKGVRYVSEEPPQNGRYAFSFGGPGNDPDSISKGLQYTPDCEKQVAAQGIGN
ncbi:MAG TPA: hypothetical protein VFG87_29335 [Amycolatopsis sp.]|nr:hypothetical protein [Amycolatopsis sp.]